MKLSQLEDELIRGNITDDIIADFKTALKRVPKHNRCQHCYITAVQMPLSNYLDAISLIELGLNEYCDSWFDEMRSYSNMAIIYEETGDYLNTLRSYKNAMRAVEPDKRSSYENEFAAQMLRAEIHCNGFEYTDNLRSYYDLSMKQDEFSMSFGKRMFYQALAEMLIFNNDNENAKADAAYKRAKEMLEPQYKGPLSALLQRHKYEDTIKASREAIQFLKSWEKTKINTKGRI